MHTFSMQSVLVLFIILLLPNMKAEILNVIPGKSCVDHIHSHFTDEKPNLREVNWQVNNVSK